MNQGADTADQMVQEGIQVTESAVKLAGLGVKNLAIILLQLLQDNKKLKGETGLNGLLKTNKPLVTFTMDKAALPNFKDKAGEYGVLFSSVHHADNGKQCDIMVKAEDAAVVHRIFDAIQTPAKLTEQAAEGKSNQNWFQQATQRLTDPAKRFENKTGPLEGLGAETLAALVYQLAAENRQHLDASPLSFVFEEGKGLQFTEVPDFCKKDVLEQAEVLGIPVHFQASDTPGKVTMMAKSEDAPILNRLFENTGLEKPMQEMGHAFQGKRAQEKAQGAPVHNEKADNVKRGHSSVRVAFAQAKQQAQAGKSPVAAAHKTAKGKAAAR